MDQTVISMFAYVVVGCGVAGLAVGSFLNVVVHRVPLGMSVVDPHTACPDCAHELTPRDNIPVVSWLLLKGRCRHCQTTISVRYPAIEALTAALFVVTALRFGVSWTLPAELAFVAGLVALAACDLERFLLPKRIVYPTLVITGIGLAVAAGATGHWVRLGWAAVCGAVAAGLFFALHVARPKWLGFGDVRLAGLLGVGLGWVAPVDVLIGLIFANLAGTIVGVFLVASGRAKRDTALPYGAFLAGGAIAALWVSSAVVHWYGYGG